MAYVVHEHVIMLKITKHQGNLFELTAEGTLDHGDYQRVLPEMGMSRWLLNFGSGLGLGDGVLRDLGFGFNGVEASVVAA